MGEEAVVSKNFIEQEIEKDLREGVYQEVCTRFPSRKGTARLFIPDFHRNRTDIFILDMPSLFC